MDPNIEETTPLTFDDAKKLQEEVVSPSAKPDPVLMGTIYSFLRGEIRSKKTVAMLDARDFDLHDPEIDELRRNGWIVCPENKMWYNSWMGPHSYHIGWVVELPGFIFTFEDAVRVHYHKPAEKQHTEISEKMKRVYEKLRYEVERDRLDIVRLNSSEIDEDGVEELRSNGWRVTNIYDSLQEDEEKYTVGWNVELPRSKYGSEAR